jgi:hypothetical protein
LGIASPLLPPRFPFFFLRKKKRLSLLLSKKEEEHVGAATLGGYEKIIQQAMRMVMETVLEPTFLDSSHGFRFGRGCHTALRQVKS